MKNIHHLITKNSYSTAGYEANENSLLANIQSNQNNKINNITNK